MMSRLHIPAASVLLMLLLAACGRHPPQPPDVIETLSAPTANGVTFQPPIGRDEVLTGNLQRGLNLTIDVFRLDTDDLVASYSTIDGTVVEIHEPGVREHYEAIWNSGQARLPNDTTVRIEVRLGDTPGDAPSCQELDLSHEVGGCLAFVDARLVRPPVRGPFSTHRQLVNGQTLPIKVHVEGDGDDELVPDPPAGDGSASGGLGAVRYAAAPGQLDGTAEASFRLSGRTDPFGEVRVTILGPDSGTITFGGVTMDGFGPLTSEEREALEALAASSMADALALVPLDLACQEGAADLSPAVGAALLMPWQMILKYLTPDRHERIRGFADRSPCAYFPDLSQMPVDEAQAPSASIVMLSRQSPIPAAFGYFPFDGEGAVESGAATLQRAVRAFEEAVALVAGGRDEFGPGNATCRGACGADCPPSCRVSNQPQCAVRGGTEGVLDVRTFTCGTHQGCRDHDGCYDICNAIFGADSWAAAVCRRPCDVAALQYATAAFGVIGPAIVTLWANGYGPYDGEMTFEYTRDAPDAPERFTPCAPGERCEDGECVGDPPPPPPPPPPPSVPASPPCVSCGDVHLYTLDGLAYDYQGVGEYVLVESSIDDFTVQTRQQPWGSSTVVSVNTAVAMNVLGDRLGIYLDRSPGVYVNGEPVVVEARLALPNGGEVHASGREHLVVWPNGTVVGVRNFGSYLDVGMTLPTAMRGQVTGLIGNFDGDPTNDLVTRDGLTTVSLPPSAEDIHTFFGDSWRITQAESLFDYEPGTDTSTFTDLAFPTRYVSVSTLTDAEYDAARQVCEQAGITDPVLLENCILDVAVTGDETFAESTSEAMIYRLSLPSSLNVQLGQSASLPITLSRPAPAGGLLITLTSSDSAVIGLASTTVSLPEGAIGGNATVFGTSLGTAIVSATAPGFGTASSEVTAAGNLNILEGSVTFTTAFTQAITIRLEVGGTAVPAPVGGLDVTLDSADAGCAVALTSPVTIPSGQVQATAHLVYGGSAATPCSTNVTASSPGYVSSTVDVRVDPAPQISAPNVTVGAWLQTPVQVNLGASAHGGVQVTVASSAASTMLVSPNATTAGTTSFTTTIPSGTQFFTIWVQGVQASNGTAELQIGAPAFESGTATITVATPGVEIHALPATTTTLSANSNFYVQVGLPCANGTQLCSVQNVRAGSGGMPVTITNTDATVAQLVTPTGASQNPTITIAENSYYSTGTQPFIYGIQFDPLAAGTTTVTASATDATTMTTTGVRTVTVTAAQISAQNATVGAWLQTPVQVNLGAGAHGGVDVTVDSSAPSTVLVSPNATTPGAASFTTTIPNGTQFFTIWVQGVEGSTGTADLQVEAPGFTSGTAVVSVATPGIEIQGLAATTTSLSANSNFYVQVGLPCANAAQLCTVQNVRAGSGGMPVTVANSEASVAQLVTPAGGAQSRVVTIAENIYYSTGTQPFIYGIQFDPLAAGTTTVTASATDVTTMTTTGVRAVTVTGAQISLPNATVGAWLQTPVQVNLGAGAHGGVDVTVDSSAPSTVLVSPNATTPGAASFTTTIPNGTQFFSVWVQGVEGSAGTAELQISAPGFTSGTAVATVVAPGVEVQGLPATTTTLSANSNFYVQVGLPCANAAQLCTVQNVRAGSGGMPVTVANSEASVAQLVTPAGGAQSRVVTIAENIYYSLGTSPFIYGIQFDPLAAGTTTVTASATDVATMTTTGIRTVSVTAAQISVPSVTVGAWLQTPVQVNLGAGAHGGVEVTVASSAPSVMLVSPNGTTAGAASFTTTIPNGTQFFNVWVQGVEGRTGTAALQVAAPGFLDGSATTTIVTPGIEIQGLPTTTAASSANSNFYVQVGVPCPNLTQLCNVQNVRAGSGGMPVTVTNADASVAQLVTPAGAGQTRSLTIAENVYYSTGASPFIYGIQFDPLAAGTTTVTAAATDVTTMTSTGVRSVNVTP